MARVVLFHNSDLPPDFQHELIQYGIEILTIDVLYFEFDEFKANLTSAFEITKDYAGVVLPSPRAVEAVAQVAELLSLDTEFYCVGPKTALELERRLGRTATLTGTKGASQLSGLITMHLRESPRRSVIYISGDLQTTLQTRDYEDQGVSIIQVISYSTKEIESPILGEAISKVALPSAVVFFSPSGVSSVESAARFDRGTWDWRLIKLFAIGETTGRAVEQRFGRCDGWPEASNLDSVKQLLIDRFGKVT